MSHLSNAHDLAAGVQVVTTRLLPGQHSSTYQIIRHITPTPQTINSALLGADH